MISLHIYVQIMYSDLAPNGPLKLYHFIIVVAVVLSLLSQLPSFHSLRYINLGSLLLSFGYTILVSAACIRAGNRLPFIYLTFRFRVECLLECNLVLISDTVTARNDRIHMTRHHVNLISCD